MFLHYLTLYKNQKVVVFLSVAWVALKDLVSVGLKWLWKSRLGG